MKLSSTLSSIFFQYKYSIVHRNVWISSYICIYIIYTGCCKTTASNFAGAKKSRIYNVGCTSKKIDLGFATELCAFEIEKLKHIFTKISKTTDLNLTKFCTLTFPATFFPMMNSFFSIMVRFVKTAICTQIMPKKMILRIFFGIKIMFSRFIIMSIQKKELVCHILKING